MNTTVRIKASEITKDWHVIDAAGRPLGRVATEAAAILRGKHKPTYEPHLDDGDFVIIVNAAKVMVSGRKQEQITYYRHSGYPGGLKSRSYAEQFERFPERVLEQAVWGMLPNGPLGEKMAKHLKVYRGPNHPHASQVVGSERARQKREAERAASAGEPRKAPRLRPLAVPQGSAELAGEDLEERGLPVAIAAPAPQAALEPPPAAAEIEAPGAADRAAEGEE